MPEPAYYITARIEMQVLFRDFSCFFRDVGSRAPAGSARTGRPSHFLGGSAAEKGPAKRGQDRRITVPPGEGRYAKEDVPAIVALCGLALFCGAKQSARGAPGGVGGADAAVSRRPFGRRERPGARAGARSNRLCVIISFSLREPLCPLRIPACREARTYSSCTLPPPVDRRD